MNKSAMNFVLKYPNVNKKSNNTVYGIRFVLFLKHEQI